MGETRLLRRDEVSELLAIKPSAVRRMERSGELRYVQLGPKMRRYRSEDVAQLVAARLHTTQSQIA